MKSALVRLRWGKKGAKKPRFLCCARQPSASSSGAGGGGGGGSAVEFQTYTDPIASRPDSKGLRAWKNGLAEIGWH